MNYTDIENLVLFKGTDDEEVVVNWRKRLGRVQLRCPYCDSFFKVPKDVKFNSQGYASSSIYHFCDDEDIEIADDSLGWVVWAHLVGYNL